MPYLVKQRQTWCPGQLSAEAMNAIWILRSDQIGSKLQSESAREHSRVCFWRNWKHLLKWCNRKVHPQKTKISLCPECIWPQSPCARDVEISTSLARYLPTTPLVTLFLLSWTCMTLYTLMMRWKDSLHKGITGLCDPICTVIKSMSSRSIVRSKDQASYWTWLYFSCALNAGSTTQLGLAPIHLWAVCGPMHVYGWAWPSLLKSNIYLRFKYLGVFETETVDPVITTVNVQQLLYHILWPHVWMTRKWESQVQQLLKCQNNKQMLPNILRIFSFPQDRGLIEDGAFGPQAEEADIIMVSCALVDALSGKNIIKVLSDDIDGLVLPGYLCHDKALHCKLQMQSWGSTAFDINATCVELSTEGLQLPGM